MTATEPGLRELKKRMTRAKIADAALQLSLDRGFEQVTIDGIARQAFVSPRTVSNYFSSKEEAVIVSGGLDWVTVLGGVAERPVDEPPLESLGRLAVDFVRSRTPEQQRATRQQVTLLQQQESLVPHEMAEYVKLEQSLRVTIAERTGTDACQDMYPCLVAAAAVSAIKSAMGLWGRTGTPAGELPDLIEEGFRQLSAGLPFPGTAPRASDAAAPAPDTEPELADCVGAG